MMTGYPSIKSVIDGKGFKMKFVARSLGWHPSKLSQIIGGHRQPKPAELIALAKFLGQPEGFFLNQTLANSKRAQFAPAGSITPRAGFKPEIQGTA